MQKTLLQIVQSILDEMDADNVNSIGDTIESIQVASIVRDCYEELLSNRNWPHMKQLIQLEASRSTGCDRRGIQRQLQNPVDPSNGRAWNNARYIWKYKE